MDTNATSIVLKLVTTVVSALGSKHTSTCGFHSAVIHVKESACYVVYLRTAVNKLVISFCISLLKISTSG